MPTYSVQQGGQVTATPFDMGAGPSRRHYVPAIRDFPPGCGPVDNVHCPSSYRPEESEPTIESYGSWTSDGSGDPRTGVAPRIGQSARISVRPVWENQNWAGLPPFPEMPPHAPPVPFPFEEPLEAARHSVHLGYPGMYQDPYLMPSQQIAVDERPYFSGPLLMGGPTPHMDECARYKAERDEARAQVGGLKRALRQIAATCQRKVAEITRRRRRRHH
ncbi:hypothetical protein QVD17_16706 [Tagetes erecta]|uniref:Uncharacterized protein n=1 Tax=Tagetes erecta TaxID=13708 RepID=A0AAD8KY96_TARER|nr:hypothetical protein QVD17_16706 [Tagetes erecta]